MIRHQCVCGAPLRGLETQGPERFAFVPSSSLAHINYEIEFNRGVCLPGGRIFEQCKQCWSLVLCAYPESTDGTPREDDPMVTYGPGTVYEPCEISVLPAIYLSFRGLVSSGVTGGVMYSGAFPTNLADWFHTQQEELPPWKVVKDALLDGANTVLDEWWSASIGRNFIVLYENAKVLRPVAAWHRVQGEEVANPQIDSMRSTTNDPRSQLVDDVEAMNAAHDHVALTEQRRQIIDLGNHARLRLIDSAVRIGRSIVEVAQWAPRQALEEGIALYERRTVRSVDETVFGIWHAIVRDDDAHCDMLVDMLVRHNAISKIACTCEDAQHRHVCCHMTAALIEISHRMQLRMSVDDLRPTTRHTAVKNAVDGMIDSDRYRHYADAFALIHGVRRNTPRHQWLTKFIEPIAGATSPLYHVEMMLLPHSTRRVRYCVYSNTMLAFIEEVVNRDIDYARVLKRHGLDISVSLDILNVDVMDADLVEALITMLVHRERRSEGTLAELLENGMLLRMLHRLRALDEHNSAPRANGTTFI